MPTGNGSSSRSLKSKGRGFAIGAGLPLEDRAAFERRKQNRGVGDFAVTVVSGGSVTVDHEGLPALCKAIWETFGKVKITPKQLEKLYEDVQLGTAIFHSPVEMYNNGDRKLYLDWLKDVKAHMEKHNKRFTMGGIIPYLRGYGWQYIGYFAWMKRRNVTLPQPIAGDYVDEDIKKSREIQDDFERFVNDPVQGQGREKTMAEQIAERARRLGNLGDSEPGS